MYTHLLPLHPVQAFFPSSALTAANDSCYGMLNLHVGMCQCAGHKILPDYPQVQLNNQLRIFVIGVLLLRAMRGWQGGGEDEWLTLRSVVVPVTRSLYVAFVALETLPRINTYFSEGLNGNVVFPTGMMPFNVEPLTDPV